MLIVENLMQRHVLTLHMEDTVDRAFFMFHVEKIRHLPVVDKNRIVGMVSDRDILKALGRRSGRRTSPQRIRDNESELYVEPRKVRHIMSRGVVTVAPGDPAGKAAEIMGKKKIGALPVLLEGQLVGIITATDILLAFGRLERGE